MATEKRLADFTKSNQRKLPADLQEKARTEKHPLDETDAPAPEARKAEAPKSRSTKRED